MKFISAIALSIAAAATLVQAVPADHHDHHDSHDHTQHADLFVGFEGPHVNSCRNFDIVFTCEHAPCTIRAYRKHFNEPMWRYIVNDNVYDATYRRLAQNNPGTRYTLTITDRLNKMYTSKEVKLGKGSLSCLPGNKDEHKHDRHD